MVFVGDPKSGTSLISNSDFGGAIKKRSGSMMYFNTSCWSKNKAKFELQASGPKLINICSLTMVNFFRNGDALSEMLDQFLKKATYSQMRDAMKKDESYKKKEMNYFIFPDTDEYQRNITDAIRFATKIDYQLISPEGRPTNIDELDH